MSGREDGKVLRGRVWGLKADKPVSNTAPTTNLLGDLSETELNSTLGELPKLYSWPQLPN